jgi:hypothetical protein
MAVYMLGNEDNQPDDAIVLESPDPDGTLDAKGEKRYFGAGGLARIGKRRGISTGERKGMNPAEARAHAAALLAAAEWVERDKVRREAVAQRSLDAALRTMRSSGRDDGEGR